MQKEACINAARSTDANLAPLLFILPVIENVIVKYLLLLKKTIANLPLFFTYAIQFHAKKVYSSVFCAKICARFMQNKKLFILRIGRKSAYHFFVSLSISCMIYP